MKYQRIHLVQVTLLAVEVHVVHLSMTVPQYKHVLLLKMKLELH